MGFREERQSPRSCFTIDSSANFQFLFAPLQAVQRRSFLSLPSCLSPPARRNLPTRIPELFSRTLTGSSPSLVPTVRRRTTHRQPGGPLARGYVGGFGQLHFGGDRPRCREVALDQVSAYGSFVGVGCDCEGTTAHFALRALPASNARQGTEPH